VTDKISKELAKLTAKEKETLKIILLQLKQNELRGLNVSKLKGQTDIYRVKKGRLRIIYQQTDTQLKVLAIERRFEKTYRNF
jgi:mRNA-degrading endonuclease RelE of RelBE toxin-antitoxin system